ncbi:hypothetical protein, partial [Mesorhizobium sp. M7A.F.Ca.CA.001.12.1.1]|uniref:hypothetical protein n=1 Tax=Mesorhizobium sp. M7A.F.Ca.CA.001.12.1.1 TaxID=2496724 RepID=UPI0019D2E148
ADMIDRAGGIAFADFRHRVSLLDLPHLCRHVSSTPTTRARWSEPEKPNDIKSLIDLNILKVV